MKTRYKILIGLVVVIIGIGITFAILINRVNEGFEELMAQELVMPDLSLIDDGTYEGNYSTFPVTVSVNVTVENHIITQIVILKHVNGQGGPAEVIVDDVILSQSLDVDLISGASYSSVVILLAIEDALNQ